MARFDYFRTHLSVLPAGDVNGDCVVDDADLLAVLFSFGASGEWTMWKCTEAYRRRRSWRGGCDDTATPILGTDAPSAPATRFSTTSGFPSRATTRGGSTQTARWRPA
ncbi:MAG: hypothetical protein ACK4ME_05200 [Fimbriimonadales bacterium]